jgi:hypothetical protein
MHNSQDIRHQLRSRMQAERARLLQAAEFPDPTEVYVWSIQLEVLRRLDKAHKAGDLTSLRKLLSMARRILSWPRMP